MAFLIDENTHYLIQGITGKEGTRALRWMQAAGAKVVAGVTPGKGGQEVDGVPVYDKVQAAVDQHPQISASTVFVPPRFVLGAVTESIEAKLSLIHIIAEGVPTADTAKIIELSRQNNVRIVGPSSIGISSPGKSQVGSIAGGNPDMLMSPTDKGGVAIISKSGGMAGTIASMLTLGGIPQTTVVGIGGDRLIGTTFADLLPDLSADDETKAVVIIGELGGSYEEDFAAAIISQQFKKPVIAFISGVFAETLPQGVAFGHAGAIVSKTIGTRQGKIDALSNAGAIIVNNPNDIAGVIKQTIEI